LPALFLSGGATNNTLNTPGYDETGVRVSRFGNTDRAEASATQIFSSAAELN